MAGKAKDVTGSVVISRCTGETDVEEGGVTLIAALGVIGRLFETQCKGIMLNSAPRRPNRFRERELARMLRAGRRAGARSARVIFEDGQIVVDFDFSVGEGSLNGGKDALLVEMPEDIRKVI